MSELIGYSPLWRAGFYGCTVLSRLQVSDDETLQRRQFEIDKLLTECGLTIIDQGTAKYSEDSEHGYTYETCLTQSGAMIHTYPELAFATAMFETCGPIEPVVRKAVDELTWYYKAQHIEFFEAPRLVFPSRAGEIPQLTRINPEHLNKVVNLDARRKRAQ